MLIRRRPYAYFGIAVISVWSVLTYYLAVHRTFGAARSEAREEMHPIDTGAVAVNLRAKIDKIQIDIRKQKNDNDVLLRLIQNGSSHFVASSSGELDKATNNLPSSANDDQNNDPIAVLVIACNRPKAIRNHLDQLLRLRPSKESFPIIVSQDCNHEDTSKVLRSYGDQIIFVQQPDQSDITLPPKMKKFLGYYKISRHYRWALNQTFYTFGYKAAIITEDDLDLSPDFFEYFTATYRLLNKDPSLWCASAWNDNGKASMIEDKPDLLHRTDFFPGLGWMLKHDIWSELEPIWPAAFWDDWMRRPEQRKDRVCIRPEISRTAMSQHGKVGVSRGLYFEKHLKLIKLNNVTIPFTKMDLSFLLKDRYDRTFVDNVNMWPSITQAELISGHFVDGRPLPPAVRLTYTDKVTFKNAAKTLKLMEDFRAGVPRTAYRGVVSFMYGKIRVYLAPPPDWKGYDPSWT